MTAEISRLDELHIGVSRCLSAWNGLEGQLLQIPEYAVYGSGPIGDEIRAAYWAVFSFENRLKWCDAIVSIKLAGAQHGTLLDQWKHLRESLRTKAKKRNEVAHGTVIIHGVHWADGTETPQTAFFVPYYQKRRDDWKSRPAHEFDLRTYVRKMGALEPAVLMAREEAFLGLRKRTRDFLEQWTQSG